MDVVAHTWNASAWRLRQVDCWEFQTNRVYPGRSRLAWTIKWDFCLKTNYQGFYWAPSSDYRSYKNISSGTGIIEHAQGPESNPQHYSNKSQENKPNKATPSSSIMRWRKGDQEFRVTLYVLQVKASMGYMNSGLKTHRLPKMTWTPYFIHKDRRQQGNCAAWCGKHGQNVSSAAFSGALGEDLTILKPIIPKHLQLTGLCLASDEQRQEKKCLCKWKCASYREYMQFICKCVLELSTMSSFANVKISKQTKCLSSGERIELW